MYSRRKRKNTFFLVGTYSKAQNGPKVIIIFFFICINHVFIYWDLKNEQIPRISMISNLRLKNEKKGKKKRKTEKYIKTELKLILKVGLNKYACQTLSRNMTNI